MVLTRRSRSRFREAYNVFVKCMECGGKVKKKHYYEESGVRKENNEQQHKPQLIADTAPKHYAKRGSFSEQDSHITAGMRQR